MAVKSTPSESVLPINEIKPLPITIPTVVSVKQEVVDEIEAKSKERSIVEMSAEQVKQALDASIQDLELTTLIVDSSWIVFQRKNFDLKVMGEPYHGIRLVYNDSSGSYIHRVWGKTKTKGEVDTVEALAEVLSKVFRRTVPCLGYYEFQNGFSMSREDLVAVEYPVARVISKDCVHAYK